MSENEIGKVLIVDDEGEARHLIRKYLELDFKNLEFQEASNGKEAMDIVMVWSPTVVLTDINMPKMNGLDLLRAIKERMPKTQCVIFTGRDDHDTPVKALREGASDYLMKPLNMEELSIAIQRAIKKWETEDELEKHRERLEALLEQRTLGLLELDESLRKEKESKQVLEEQMRQAQKMEAIGTLAGGIAHDFNNILSAIIGYTDLTMDNLAEGSRERTNLEKVLNAGNRAKDLVKQILTFSRHEEKALKPVRLQPLLKESIKLLRATMPATIEIVQEIDPDAGMVMADPTQVSQIVMNLCTNAFHAMGEKGGVLEVSLKQIDIGNSEAKSLGNLKAGPYLALRIKDNGEGMDEEVIKRIFEPFFTTKEVGKGTGLGLSVAHGIVKSHKGGITAESKLGEGSTFSVYLPVIEEVLEEKEEAVGATPRGANEKILIVDDEAPLVEMWEEMLERLGYQVVAKTSAVDALTAFQEDPNGFDLLITDQTMPMMTGTELGGEIMKIRSDLPMILCTGFSQSVTPEMAKIFGFSEYLMKPLVSKDLGPAIRRALEKRSNKEA